MLHALCLPNPCPNKVAPLKSGYTGCLEHLIEISFHKEGPAEPHHTSRDTIQPATRVKRWWMMVEHPYWTLIRTDTTLDPSQKAEKQFIVYLSATFFCFSFGFNRQVFERTLQVINWQSVFLWLKSPSPFVLVTIVTRSSFLSAL